MPSTDLMELASRVAAGEGDAREIFEEAYTVIHGLSWQAAAYHHGSLGGEPDQTKQEAAFRFGELVRVAAWLDAAVMLIPKGDTWMVDNFDGTPERPCTAVVSVEVFATTPARALLASTLHAHIRARAHQGTAHVEQ